MDKLKPEKVNQLNPSVWAFAGDAVFSLFVRQMLIERHDYKTGELTKRANGYVNAKSQSDMLEKIQQHLTEAEKEIVKRARNCHTFSKAKNAGIMDYKRSTAFEGLLGYLYLTNEQQRLEQLLELSVTLFETNGG